MKIKKIFLMLILVLCGLGCYFFIFKNDGNGSDYSYKEFYSLVEENKISSAEISDDSIEFTLKSDKTVHSVKNPHSPSLIEYLLLHDVEVHSEKSIEEDIFADVSIFFL